MLVIGPPIIGVFATAPVVKVAPLKLTVGGDVYPEPKLVIVIAVTTPPTTVAKPAAVTPDVGGVKATLGTDK
jgi:hypothetical protein